MRTQNLAILIFLGCLAFNTILAVYLELGVVNAPGTDNNFAFGQEQLIEMTDPTTGVQGANILESTWNTVTGYGYSLLTVGGRIVYMKGTLDDWVQGQYPYTVLINGFQAFVWASYIIGAFAFISNRAGA